MKRSMIRRSVAAVAAASIALVSVSLSAPAASAAEACALGATCEGKVAGTLGESTYKIVMPAKFNGTVLLYSHGYRIATPVPAALAQPLGLTSAPYVKISQPAFATAFGSDVAYIGGGSADVAPSDAVAQNLLAQGYALAGAGYAKQGWATAEGVEAGTLLLNHVRGGGVAGVKKVLAWGTSLGGLIAQVLAEKNPGKIAGSLPTCAPLAGPEQAFSSAMTVLYTWKQLIAPTLRVANYQSYTQALTDLATVLQTLNGVAAGTVSVSAVGFPVAQANLLAGLTAGLPTKSAVYDGESVNPAFATMGTAAAMAGGFQPASAGASSAAAMLQNVGAAAALGVLGRYELEQRARVIANIPADQSANFNDNVDVRYTSELSEEQRGEFGDTLNASPVMPNLLNAMQAKVDSTLGDANARFPQNPAAVLAVRALPAPTGVYKSPTVLISTTYDPIVPAGNTQWFYGVLSKNAKAVAKKTKKVAPVSQFYTVPLTDTWTVFDAGAKGPNAAASAAGATSGVGHCNFTTDQLLGSVAALNRLVSAKTASQVKAANKLVYAKPGVNNDGMFRPDPLKRAQG